MLIFKNPKVVLIGHSLIWIILLLLISNDIAKVAEESPETILFFPWSVIFAVLLAPVAFFYLKIKNGENYTNFILASRIALIPVFALAVLLLILYIILKIYYLSDG